MGFGSPMGFGGPVAPGFPGETGRLAREQEEHGKS
jgi:hypothetical protein